MLDEYFRKLMKLEQMECVSVDHQAEINELLGARVDHGFGSYSAGQEQAIDRLFDFYLPDMAKEAAYDDRTAYPGRPVILSLLQEHGQDIRGLAKKELKFHLLKYRDAKRVADREWQRKVREDLQVAVELGAVRPGSENFCWSIIEQFDERKFWTAVQMETAEKILAGNKDPGD